MLLLVGVLLFLPDFENTSYGEVSVIPDRLVAAAALLLRVCDQRESPSETQSIDNYHL